MAKIFRQEIETLFGRLKSRVPFAFSKYADGEWSAMRGGFVNNGEFISAQDEHTEFSRRLLIDSFMYKHPSYYVGISCPCCQGQEFYNMKTASRQDESNLTFANIFVNSNYNFYKNNFVPEYSNWKVNLIANEKSDISKLSFQVERFFPVGVNAWVNNLDLLGHLKQLNTEGELYLFCAGPFGNILAKQLWQHNQKNTYLDIGSTLNPWLGFEGFKRGYLYGSEDCNKVCVWG
jgi:hypothetical protein